METGKIEIDMGGTLNNILFKIEVLERDVDKLKSEVAKLRKAQEGDDGKN